MSVEPVYVFDSVAEWTVTNTPAVPLRVSDWPLAPIGNVGLSCRFTVYLGTVPSNCSTKRSKPACSATRTAVTLATPVVPPAESVHAKAGRLVVRGGVAITGGGEIRGPEAAESAEGDEVALAAGVPAGPSWAQPARITHSPAATV